MLSNMNAVRLLSLAGVFWRLGAAHMIPQHGFIQRQDVSNSSTTPTITIPSTITPSATLPTFASVVSSNRTCLASYPPDYQPEYQVWAKTCERAYASAVLSFPNFAEECLRSYCDAEWKSSIQSYIDANITSRGTSTWVQWSGSFGTGSLSSVWVTSTRYTTTTEQILAPSEAVPAIPPCCDRCSLEAATVALFYWPTAVSNATAAPTGAPLLGNATYVNDAGFTFISPSIYIGFTSLGAYDRCGTVGTPVYNTTLGFDPSEISTLLPRITTATCPYPNGFSTWTHSAEMIEMTVPPPQPLKMSDVLQNCSTIEGYYYDPGHPFNAGLGAGDPCHPVVAIPERVKQLQPEWANCGPNLHGGFYDPPRTLGTGSVLVPTTASPGPSNPTVVPPTSSSVPSEPQQSDTPDDPSPSSSTPDQPNPPSSTPDQPNPPLSTPDQPNPPSSTPDQPNTPSSTPDQPNPPSSTPNQPNPPSSTPDQPNPPSSTPDQPNPPSSTPDQPNPPSSTLDQPNPPVSTPDQPSPPTSSPPGNQPEPPPSTSGGQPNPPVVGSSTVIVITPPNPSGSQPGQPPVITLPSNPTNPSDPGQVVTVIPTTLPPNPSASQGPGSSGNAVIIGSQTLTPGQVITIGGTTTTGANGQTTVVSGTPVSVDPQGTQLVIDGTSTIPLTTPAQTTAAPPLVVTLGSTTLTANSETQFDFGSTTLSVGGAPVTVSGTTYVMTTNEQGSTQLIVGTDGVSSTVAAASTTRPVAPENSVAAAAGLKNSVEVVITIVIVAALLG